MTEPTTTAGYSADVQPEHATDDLATTEETPTREWLLKRVAWYARECERLGMTAPIGPAEGEALRRLIEQLRKLPRHFQGWRNTSGWIKPEELEAALAPLSGPVDAAGEPLLRTLLASIPIQEVPGLGNVVPLAWVTVALNKLAAAVPSSPAQEGQQTTLAAAVKELRELVKSEAGHIAYFDDSLDAVIAAALRKGKSALPPSSPVADSPTKEPK